MEWMLIGSAAMRSHFDDARQAADLDIFSPREMEGIDTFWHPGLEDFVNPNPEWVANPDELYTIKISHSFWNLHGTWRKHMSDAIFLERKGAKFLPDLHTRLYAIWEDVYGKKPVHLNMTKEEFFEDKIVRIYDHDSLHESVAYYDRPLYLRILKNGSSVAVDRSKFDALSYEDQLRLAREEIYANALERKVIPDEYLGSPGAAYSWSVQQTITSLSKGWFALFVALNYDRLRLPDCDYVARHLANADKLIKLEDQ